MGDHVGAGPAPLHSKQEAWSAARPGDRMEFNGREPWIQAVPEQVLHFLLSFIQVQVGQTHNLSWFTGLLAV